eukprot:scaffold23137_cov66-Phaeocystis_antarctica.AAC.2
MANKGRAEAGKVLEASWKQRGWQRQKQLRIGRRPRRSNSRSRNLHSSICSRSRTSLRRLDGACDDDLDDALGTSKRTARGERGCTAQQRETGHANLKLRRGIGVPSTAGYDQARDGHGHEPPAPDTSISLPRIATDDE